MQTPGLPVHHPCQHCDDTGIKSVLVPQLDRSKRHCKNFPWHFVDRNEQRGAESLHSRSSLDLCDEECLAHRIDVGLNAAAHAGVGDRRGAVSVAHDDDDRAHATGAGQSTRCAALAIA